MKTFALLFLSATLAAHAQSGVFNIAKQQARRANDANNAEQQRIDNAAKDPAPRTPPAAPPSAPADPVREATLKNIADLQANFTALGNLTRTQTDPAQKAALLNDLSAAAAAGKKPAAASVQKLATHLIAATSGKKNSALPLLARNVHALFNGSHLTAAQQTMLLDGVKKNLTAAGASAEDVENVVADLKGVADETR